MIPTIRNKPTAPPEDYGWLVFVFMILLASAAASVVIYNVFQP